MFLFVIEGVIWIAGRTASYAVRSAASFLLASISNAKERLLRKRPDCPEAPVRRSRN